MCERQWMTVQQQPPSTMRMRLCLAMYLLVCIPGCSAQFPGMYCGEESCYKVLGVDRDVSKTELGKTYRKLAGMWHPDRWKTPKEKAEAEEKFRLIATAYETLKDDESRKDYDYMLDHPDEFYYNYYKYYRRRVAPKVDVRLVIAATILIISSIQYISAYHKYNECISYLMTQHKYRSQAHQIATDRGLLADKKMKRKMDKQEAKEHDERMIRQIIEEKADVQGSYQKPSIRNVLAVQMFFWPVDIAQYIGWFAQWTWRFNICREPYGDEEKHYLIRRNLNLSALQYEGLEDRQREQFFADELWISEKFTVWKAEKEEEQKQKLAENSQYKRYRRYMKNHGPQQISFGPE